MRNTEKPNDPSDLGSDPIPRLSFWQAMPKRHLFRIVFLLAALVAIIFLQQKTSTIAGCMNATFQAPVPSNGPKMSSYKLRVEIMTRDASTP